MEFDTCFSSFIRLLYFPQQIRKSGTAKDNDGAPYIKRFEDQATGEITVGCYNNYSESPTLLNALFSINKCWLSSLVMDEVSAVLDREIPAR